MNAASPSLGLSKGHVPNVLSIAGLDPSGGAGILADVKAFSALGAYGATVLTALTAQNTRGVTGVEPVAPAFVLAQLDTLLADVRIDAIKIGMLANAEIARAVAGRLAASSLPLVVDPVMVAKSGDRLLDADAIDTVRRRVLPLATIITPNLPEAGVLLGRPAPASVSEMREAARALHALGARHVLVKGGHLGGAESPDVAFDGASFLQLPAARVDTPNTHGTGCTLSAAITALLPQRPDWMGAVRDAKHYVSAALRASHLLQVGGGHGPLHHFHAWWPPAAR
jgi:hydroxymethylpyrimidine/phosphomethylpyrimidine kinase